jgi:hypothetical protein
MQLKAREDQLIAQQRLLNERIRCLNEQQLTLSVQVSDLNFQKNTYKAREAQVQLLAAEVEALTDTLQDSTSQKAHRNLALLTRVDARRLAEERLTTLHSKVGELEQEVNYRKKACETLSVEGSSELESLEQEVRKNRDSLAQLEAKAEEWRGVLDSFASEEGHSKLQVMLNMKELELLQHQSKRQAHIQAAEDQSVKLLEEEASLMQERAKPTQVIQKLRQHRLDLEHRSADLQTLNSSLTLATAELHTSLSGYRARLHSEPQVKEEEKLLLSLKTDMKHIEERSVVLDLQIAQEKARQQLLRARFESLSAEEASVTLRRKDLSKIELDIKRREFVLASRGDIEGELDLRLQGLLLSEAVRQKRHSQELRALRELASVASSKERTLKGLNY